MLPKKIESLWQATAAATNYPRLEGEQTVAVAIVGGGIAGLNLAYALMREGMKVLVMEALSIAQGTSGNTTAKITSQHELKYAYLLKHFGQGKAKMYADSQQWAVAEYGRIIKSEQIDCDFITLPAYTYARTEKGAEKIRDETEAARKLGLPAQYVTADKEIPFRIEGAVKFEGQACFHPRKYLLSLAELFVKKGGLIFEKTRATGIKEHKGGADVIAEQGVVHADLVIVATNYPFYDRGGFFLRMDQKRSYALAAKINQALPKGMFISIDDLELSFRPHVSREGEWLVIGGEDHVAGDNSDVGDRFQKLEEAARQRFDIKSVDFKWAAQDSSPIDNVAYIGRMPHSDHVFVTTGYNEWGMTTSLVSAKIIVDLIAGRENPWVPLYDPARVKPFSSIKKTIEQGTQVAKGFMSYVTKQDKTFDDLQPNQGKIIAHEGKKIAVYKDKDGNIQALSAVCTHMGCIVDWNKSEKTWDCPCHGSRFATDGSVINGPAVKKLPEAKI